MIPGNRLRDKEFMRPQNCPTGGDNMSIDEVMTGIVEYGIEQRRATINESIAFRASIRAAIEQHVAEAVAMEREACAVIGDENAKSLVSIVGLPVATSPAIQHDRAKQWGMYAAAIRARGQEAQG